MHQIRAMWVPRWEITTPQACDRVVEIADQFGLNTLFVQVRGRGDALYNSRFEPRSELLASQPEDFDPLAHLLSGARQAGIEIHAWLNANFVWESDQKPVSARHIVNAHPDWLARNHKNDLQFTRSGEVEGAYACPSNHEHRAFLSQIYKDAAANYDVDGIHLDFIRYPNPDYCYCGCCLERFESSLRERGLSADNIEREALPVEFSEEWNDFRRDNITAMVRAICDSVRQARPEVVLSAAVFPDRQDARCRRFQDWAGWACAGLLDLICPMAYSQDTEAFTGQIEDAVESSCGVPVCAGIGAWRISSASAIDKIGAARERGAAGFCLFSYSITNSGSETEYLADVWQSVAPESG